ncbi:MAG: flagellar hook-associated protein 2 [Ectobacillus sp.]
MASSVTAYGSTGTQLWGLGNTLIDTKDLVELELQALEMRKSPMLNQRQRLTNDKQAYSNFKSEFNALLESVRKLASFTGSSKAVTTSSSGSVSVQASSNAISGTYEVGVTQLAARHQIAGGALDLNAKVNLNNQISEELFINGKSLTVTPDMTYKQVIDKINAGGYGVSLYTIHNGTTDNLFMTASSSGKAGEIMLSGGTASNLWQTLGFLDANNAIKTTITEAQDAQYSINGVSLTSATNTIENALPGVTLTLENITPPTNPVKFTVGDSTAEEEIGLIEAMVTEYNNAVGKLETYAGEAGVLQGSTAALSTSRALASLAMFQLNGKYASSFGIQMDKTGRITLDKQKLQEAFKQDADGAKAFFFGINGLGKHLDSGLNKVFGETGIIGGKLKSFDDELKRVNDQIAKIDELNRTKQDAIIAKYAKFEQQMAALNAQLSYIKAATKQPDDDN